MSSMTDIIRINISFFLQHVIAFHTQGVFHFGLWICEITKNKNKIVKILKCPIDKLPTHRLLIILLAILKYFTKNGTI